MGNKMSEEYSWDMDPTDRMFIVIKHHGEKLFRLSLCEAIESSNRTEVMKHIRECDRTPWLKHWHESAMDEEVRILKGKN
jgi:hypothetical protein